MNKRPDLANTLNGALAGLVGITASADIITPFEAVIIGAIAGILVVFSINFLINVELMIRLVRFQFIWFAEFGGQLLLGFMVKMHRSLNCFHRFLEFLLLGYLLFYFRNCIKYYKVNYWASSFRQLMKKMVSTNPSIKICRIFIVIQIHKVCKGGI